MHPKEPAFPPPREETLRRVLVLLLEEQPRTAHELSQAAGVAEKEVYPHLEYIRHSLQSGPKRLRVAPAVCRACGFVFEKRTRLTPPGRCPLCRSETIAAPRFSVR